MKIRIWAALVAAVVAAGALAITASATASTTPPKLTEAAQPTLTVVTHLTNREFLTATGATPYPTGPLAPGDRILGRDDLRQGESVVGSDYEVCTVTFNLQVLCDDMVTLANQGDLHVTWTLQWSTPSGPSQFDGVVDGGTLAYRNAHGSFHAQLLPTGDLELTATLR